MLCKFWAMMTFFFLAKMEFRQVDGFHKNLLQTKAAFITLLNFFIKQSILPPEVAVLFNMNRSRLLQAADTLS